MVGRLSMSITKRVNSTQPAATLEKLLGRSDDLARSVGLIQRRSWKFSAQGFILTLLHAVCHGHASFGAMAMRLSEFEPASLTRQSFHERLQEKAIRFRERILTSLLIEREIGIVGKMDFPSSLLKNPSQVKSSGYLARCSRNATRRPRSRESSGW